MSRSTNPTSEVPTLRDEVRAATDRLSALETDLRRQHAAAQRQRQFLLNAPPPRAELIENMEALVDSQAEAAATKHLSVLVGSFGGGFDVRRDGALKPRQPRLPELFSNFDALTFPGLCFLAPALVKDRLRQILESAPIDEGAPMDERLALVAQCDARIQELEQAHTALVDEAARVGIKLSLLPSVQQRREREASLTKQRAEEDERRARYKAQLDAFEASRPRGGPSQYLGTGTQPPSV